MIAKVTKVRMSGLGGQGVVTAAHILGVAATEEGLVSTVNPFFGAEKRLAPAESYVRISKEEITERGEILFPHIIMIFHPHVITMGKCYTMPFFDGLQPEGTIMINSDKPLDLRDEDLQKLAELKTKLFYLPATQIAIDVGGTELSSNIALLGGLLGATSIVSFKALKAAVIDRFGGTKKFVASGTTAALDDVMKSKFAKKELLIEKNMEVAKAASKLINEYSL